MLRTLLPLALLFASCSEKEKATYAAPPEYQTLHLSKSNGAFFQFEHDGDHYLACSIHQAHLKPGTQLFRDGSQEPVTLEKRIHQQKDLQVWTFKSSSLKPEHLLKYHSDPDIQINDRIYFLNKGQKIAATVVALPQGEQFRHTYRTDTPFAANGMSGSPVYLPRTGAVIGVLQTANDKTKATLGGFETLKLE